MTRPLADILRNDRYNESELSGDGRGGERERGYRRGWNGAMDHVEREVGEEVVLPPPIVSGPHTIADFDLSDADEEPTRG